MSTALNEVPGWYVEFQAALLRQAPRPGEIDQTTAERWTRNQKGLRQNLAACLLPQIPVVSVESTKIEPLLDLVGTITVPATTHGFVAKEKFVVNTKHDAPVKISSVYDNFTRWFLSGDGKTEDPIREQTICYHNLRFFSYDRRIMTELGGGETSETTLTELFYLMEKQKDCKAKFLTNLGNLFYIKDQRGVFRLVEVGWDTGFCIGASPIGRDRHLAGYRVFSRNPIIKSSEPSAKAQA